MFIHSYLVESKTEFYIGSLPSLKGSSLGRTLWCPQNLFQTPYKSPVWSGCEKRGDARLAETPLLHIHVQIYGGDSSNTENAFKASSLNTSAHLKLAGWRCHEKITGVPLGLENKPLTHVQKVMLQRTKKEHSINNNCISEQVQGYISAFMASLDWKLEEKSTGCFQEPRSFSFFIRLDAQPLADAVAHGDN